VSREDSYLQAAACYIRAGDDLDAARCYRLAGAHRRAADIYEGAGGYADAAAAFADAGLPERGAWLLVHRAGQPARARALLAAVPAAPEQEVSPRSSPGQPGQPRQRLTDLRRELVLARCDIAEGTPADDICTVIANVCAALADSGGRADQVAEEWAVAVSEAAARYDQAALVFAAAVRGGRYGAEQRWQIWSRQVLGTNVIIPKPVKAQPATTPPTAD
jgi:hypothetical protein